MQHSDPGPTMHEPIIVRDSVPPTCDHVHRLSLLESDYGVPNFGNQAPWLHVLIIATTIS